MAYPDLRVLSGRILVRIADVSESQAALSVCESFLVAPERERAARFRFLDDRDRFVLGRGLLRGTLAQLLDVRPQEVDIFTTPKGRPMVRGDHRINFSISHTHDLVALALAIDAQVGIDLEYVDPEANVHALAEKIFSPTDLRKFRSLPANQTIAAFFRGWTGKEAYLKALGEGIAGGMDQVSVPFHPDDAASSPSDARDASGSSKWRLYSLPVPPGYAGHLACDRADKRLACEWVRQIHENGAILGSPAGS